MVWTMLEAHAVNTSSHVAQPMSFCDTECRNDIWDTASQVHSLTINPLDARRRYTDFAQTSLRLQTAVYRPNGLLPHTRRKTVYLRHGV